MRISSKMIYILISAVICISNLLGCQNNEDDEKASYSQSFSFDHYDLPPIQKEEKNIKEDEDLLFEQDHEFPDPYKIIKTIKALGMRKVRKAIYDQVKVSNTISTKNVSSSIKQKEYSVEINISSPPDFYNRTIQPSMYITGLLETDINSKNQGKVIIVTDRPVLSMDMETILLPSYSKVICHYKPLKISESNRLMIACNKILLPDGAEVKITNTTLNDEVNQSGIGGKIYSNAYKNLGIIFLLSAVSGLSNFGAKLEQKYLRHSLGIITPLERNINNAVSKNLHNEYFILIKRGTRIVFSPQNSIYFPHYE